MDDFGKPLYFFIEAFLKAVKSYLRRKHMVTISNAYYMSRISLTFDEFYLISQKRQIP